MASIIPPKRGEELTPEGKPTVRFSEYLERVARTVNTSDSNIEILASINMGAASTARLEKQIAELSELSGDDSAARIAQLSKRIDSLELMLSMAIDGKLSSFTRKQKVVSITANYTTTGDEIVICLNSTPIVVTVRDNPNDLESVNIVRTNSEVSFISSAGINGVTTAIPILDFKGSPDLIYTRAAGEYNIV